MRGDRSAWCGRKHETLKNIRSLTQHTRAENWSHARLLQPKFFCAHFHIFQMSIFSADMTLQCHRQTIYLSSPKSIRLSRCITRYDVPHENDRKLIFYCQTNFACCWTQSFCNNQSDGKKWEAWFIVPLMKFKTKRPRSPPSSASMFRSRLIEPEAFLLMCAKRNFFGV